ncbi:MAG: MarR family transcriptional regulator, partial [Candidatus Latescibacteria bacterium]|nr:MarR family transcriptional regulator [Candidatus Latescibacterota bacterium]
MFEDVWKHFDENELTHSAAHHLMAVHELRRRHGYARVSDIAQHLKITKGSVSSAMKHLKERGYVQEDHNKFLELTEKGLKVVWETEATRLVVQK